MSEGIDSRKGRLIVFEGPDGTGKSTIAQHVSAALNDRGERAVGLSFPGHQEGTLGSLVYELHHNKRQYGIQGVSAAGLQALHIAAHIDAIERQIIPLLRSGTTVILDRFWWSTKVYGLLAGIPAGHVDALVGSELAFWESVRPAALFLLERDSSLNYEIEDAAWAAHRAAYRQLAEQQRRRHPVHYVENRGTIDDTVADILRILAQVDSSPPTDRTRPESGVMRVGTSPTPASQPLLEGLLPEAWTTCPGPPQDPSHWAPAEPTEVFESFWRFAAERQEVFFRRLSGCRPPWTTDPILETYKFTNVYRASDRVSQYLIRNVIYASPNDPEEVFFRILLFKLFNRIDTWRLLEKQLGSITWADYSFRRYDAVLSRALSSGQRIYSAAYIMPPGFKAGAYARKHSSHLKLVERMMEDRVPDRLRALGSMREVFELIRSYPGIGDFLAYQYVTDINYSTLTDFSEMEFVVAGPGARDGIRKCFRTLGGLNDAELILQVARRQQQEFAVRGLEFRSLWGRPLQLIDCQNLFCEVSKYARVRHPEIVGHDGRKRIKQKYRYNGAAIECWYPPKWGLNERIERWRSP